MNVKVVLLVSLLLPLSIAAQPGGFGGPGGHGGPGGFEAEMGGGRAQLIEDLKLNNSQKEALRKFKREKGEVEKLGIDLRTEQEELSELLRDTKSSEKDLLTKVDKVSELQAAMNKRKLQNFLKLRESLTKEQLTKLLSAGQQMRQGMREGAREGMRENFRERMQERFGNREGGPRGGEPRGPNAGGPRGGGQEGRGRGPGGGEMGPPPGMEGRSEPGFDGL